MGIPALFNHLYEMQQYATSLLHSPTQDVKVYLDPVMQWVGIFWKEMCFFQFRSGIGVLLAGIKEQCHIFTEDCSKLLPSIPDNLLDNMSDMS